MQTPAPKTFAAFSTSFRTDHLDVADINHFSIEGLGILKVGDRIGPLSRRPARYFSSLLGRSSSFRLLRQLLHRVNSLTDMAREMGLMFLPPEYLPVSRLKAEASAARPQPSSKPKLPDENSILSGCGRPPTLPPPVHSRIESP